MNFKRAALFGALLWVLIFFEVSILMFGFKLQTGTTYYIIHYILLAILTIICAALYFKAKVEKGFAPSFLASIIFLITGIILDSIITIPLFIIPGGGSYSSFFLNTYMLLGFLETLILVTLVGMLKK